MRITQWLVFLASLSLIFRAGYAVSENREQVTTSSVTFVLTADMPNISDARTGRYANLQTLVKQQRQISETVFFIRARYPRLTVAPTLLIFSIPLSQM